ncbi:RNA polymerase sigma-70 factor (ECF subfamily) [Pseudobacter ginsenosidimutans]|uniref:RNA polymerase sigma-70 factor (ECF subfamily) n=2 Tax=Pseudobacter ginsenosidimutans TaxID=661488 RepID=A0A4Q7MLS6_9BACT|nr:RNA polymerase sigma-70 factor (ECF subfamily) [Pseudobacter ginsenosidimutans]
MLPVPHHKERTLLSLIAAGDEAAFRELHDLYWNEVYSLAIAFTKSPQVAEDMVQEVFIRLWMKRDALGHVENFNAFFRIMVRNQLISALRKNKKQEKDLQAFINTANPVELHSIAPEVKEAISLVSKTISKLPDRQQQIFRMSREEGLSHDDIAARLNLSKKTVSNTITIILALIRKQLYKNELLLAGVGYFIVSM